MPQHPATPPITVPSPPSAEPPHSLPIVATLAPVGVSVVIFAVTQSPLALLFAALGPVIAIGSLIDARVQGRRRSRREAARFARELARAERQLAAAHDAERAALERAFPPASRGVDLWSGASSGLALRLGLGVIPSAAAVAAPAGDPGDRDSGIVAELERFAARSATLTDAPVTAPGGDGIGIVGPAVLAEPVFRSLVLGAAARLDPSAHTIDCAGASPVWLDDLPHSVRRAPGLRPVSDLRVSGERGTVRIVLAVNPDDLPSGLATVVAVSGQGGTVLDGGPTIPLLDRVGVEEARLAARRLARHALAEGLVRAEAALPTSVAFGALEQPDDDTSPVGSLAATVGVGEQGAFALDLVRQGPHAVVGGTTGSGKSELLITWVIAMATAHPPHSVNFLLVDFKGGAAFGSLVTLPHCVGMITDLDETGARRAFESLSAELRYRERFLAAAGARSIDDLVEAPHADRPGLPRLVIVVDEFAAVAAGLPDLRELFADLAARGRSLGIHLVLCTQRPTGVVRDNILANCALRVSLRVNNRADSTAVVGTDAAAHLAPDAHGRAFLAGVEAHPVAVQFAMAAPADIARAAARWSDAPPPRRPWLDPLPAVVPIGSLPVGPTAGSGGGIAFGLLDRPDEQAQPVAVWHPVHDGPLLVLGASRSGRSRTLSVLAGSDGVVHGAHDPEAAWDAVCGALDDGGPAQLLVDDLDVLVARFGADHAQEFVERFQAVLREAAARGIRVVYSLQRPSAGLGAVVALTPSRLVLRLADRQEHVLAGLAGDTYRGGLPPGAGLWRGHSVQVALGPEPRAPDPGPLAEPDPSRGLVVVAGYPRECAERLRAAFPRARIALVGDEPPGTIEVSSGGSPRVLVGDPDDWQARWGAIAAVRESIPLLVDGCSVADYRAVTRDRRLPPPLVRPGTSWLVVPRAAPQRARLPAREEAGA